MRLVKRRDLISHLERHGCYVRREGGSHTVYESPTGQIAAVPRHSDVKTATARKICSTLDVPIPIGR